MLPKRLAWALTVAVWGLGALSARADYPAPWSIDAKIMVRFDVRAAPVNLGPWYSYFPAQAQNPLPQALHGAAPGWGVQLPLTGAGPTVPPPAPTFTFGNYGVPPSYWYGGGR
jgi:hypothetical protein